MSKYEKGDGANWVRSCFPDLRLSPLGENVADLLNEWALGIYHLDSNALKRVVWEDPYYIEFRNGNTRLSTWDFSDLTRLVFLAHDYCIRVEISPLSRTTVRMTFHQRKRDGSMSQRHPTLEQAVADWRRLRPIEEPSAELASSVTG